MVLLTTTYKIYKKLTTLLRTSIAEIVKEIDRVDVNAINLINGWLCVLYCDVSVVIDNLWLLLSIFDFSRHVSNKCCEIQSIY